MPQPRFWLQVNKNYVFDNFDNLLEYLRDYSYENNVENSDYDDTLLCMIELGEDIMKSIRLNPTYISYHPDYDFDKLVRLFAAIILADRKRGITNHNAILSLLSVFAYYPDGAVARCLDDFYDLARKAMMKHRLINPGFAWSNILLGSFSPSLLANQIIKMSFESPAAAGRAFFESKGVLVVSDNDLPIIAPLNFSDFFSKNHQRQFDLPDMLRVDVLSDNIVRIKETKDLYKLTDRLIEAQRAVRPSPVARLKSYAADDEFFVRVTNVMGKFIKAETVDPSYQAISGKVSFFSPQAAQRPSISQLTQALKVGDILTVKLSNQPTFTFDLSDVFEYYYRCYANDLANTEIHAIYIGEYARGDQWISEEGVTFGVDKEILDKASDYILDEYEMAKANALPLRLRSYFKKQNVDAPVFNVYAGWPDDNAPLILQKHFTKEQAQVRFMKDFIADCRYEYEDSGITGNEYNAITLSHDDVFPLLLLMTRIYFSGIPASSERVKFISALEMLSYLLGRDKERAFFQTERMYVDAIIDFAHNNNMRPFSLSSAPGDSPVAESQKRVIEILQNYKKKEVIQDTKVSLRSNDTFTEPAVESANLADDLDKLVSASNSLIDIVEDSELNKIKQAIARRLGVDDEFKTLLDNRTFYGIENIHLEFKTSAVYPSQNRRRLQSIVADPKIQIWHILKAVNGFLNSRSGGELLIGVNDSGYAVGIDEDIKYLYNANIIIGRTVDAYRTYLQSKIGEAFRTNDPHVASTDITTAIEYNFEDNEEGITILRIKIPAYPHGPVYFKASASQRPDHIADAYIRRSGNTLPLNN